MVALGEQLEAGVSTSAAHALMATSSKCKQRQSTRWPRRIRWALAGTAAIFVALSVHSLWFAGLPAVALAAEAQQTFVFAPVSPAAALGLYSVHHWKDKSLGNHRARLTLTALAGPGAIAWAHVPWRLPPGLVIEPQQLQLRDFDGQSIQLFVVSLDRESVTLLFEPLSCGSGSEDVITVGEVSSSSPETCAYLLYYLPYVQSCETGPSRVCQTPYKRSLDVLPCAADHGATVGDKACCSQFGTVDSADMICPASLPSCQGYRFGDAWGQCVDGGEYHPPATSWGRLASRLVANAQWRARRGLPTRKPRSSEHVGVTGLRVAWSSRLTIACVLAQYPSRAVGWHRCSHRARRISPYGGCSERGRDCRTASTRTAASRVARGSDEAHSDDECLAIALVCSRSGGCQCLTVRWQRDAQ